MDSPKLVPVSEAIETLCCMIAGDVSKKRFTPQEANKAFRGLINTLCNAIGDFSDSEACDTLDDDPALLRLFEAMEQVQKCANSIPNP